MVALQFLVLPVQVRVLVRQHHTNYRESRAHISPGSLNIITTVMSDIRKGTPGDAGAVAGIFNHYVRTSDVIFSNRERSEAEMRGVLERVTAEGYPFYVSLEGDEVTGYCYAHAWQPDAVYGLTWEITIYLRHDVTGRGAGTKLLQAVIDDSRRAGAHTLVSCVTRGNAPCSRMMLRLGFGLTGCIKEAGYKFGRFLDDEFYQLML